MSDPWSTVAALAAAVKYGGSSLEDVPVLVVRIVDQDLWRKFKSPAGECEYDSFEEFAAAHPPKGLGSSVATLKDLCRSNKHALDAIDRAVQQPPGGDKRSESYRKNTVDNVNSERPTGNSESAALRRLRKDRPDLHAAVLREELSAHAAATKAGFRKHQFTVIVSNPEKIAATLRRQLPEDVLKRVVNILEGW